MHYHNYAAQVRRAQARLWAQSAPEVRRAQARLWAQSAALHQGLRRRPQLQEGLRAQLQDQLHADRDHHHDGDDARAASVNSDGCYSASAAGHHQQHGDHDANPDRDHARQADEALNACDTGQADNALDACEAQYAQGAASVVAADQDVRQHAVTWPAVLWALALLLHPTPAYNNAPQVLAAGTNVGSLSIPAIGEKTKVVQGSMKMYNSPDIFLPELDHGPAIYPANFLPWQQGTVVMSGHRITHTHPFRNLGNVRLGQMMTFTTRWGVFRYRIVPPPKGAGYRWNGYPVSTSPCVKRHACAVFSTVLPDGRPRNAWVFGWHRTDGHRLVLVACTPKGDDAFRLLVFARRVNASYGPLTLPG
jgi:sortase (surface protein transpeptidase)